MFTYLKSTFLVVVLVAFGAGAFYFSRGWELSRVQSDHESEEINISDLATVVVSSDLGGRGNCQDHYTEGCDLFSAQVDLSTGEVTNVKQLTRDEAGDIFPVLSQDGTKVYYTESTEAGDSAMEISMEGGTARTLSTAANHPFPTADGTQVFFTVTKGFFLASLDLTDPTALVQKIENMMSTHEPHVSLTGLVGFYRSTVGETRGSKTSQAMIYNPDTGETVEVSSADGTAHCFWNYDGSALYCNNSSNGGILFYSVSADGSVGASGVAIPFPSVATLAEVDSRFDSDCVATSVEYGSFCDETHVLLTAACYVKSEGELKQDFTQTVILNTSFGEFLPLGKNLVESYGDSAGTTWTGTCVTNL